MSRPRHGWRPRCLPAPPAVHSGPLQCAVCSTQALAFVGARPAHRGCQARPSGPASYFEPGGMFCSVPPPADSGWRVPPGSGKWHEAHYASPRRPLSQASPRGETRNALQFPRTSQPRTGDLLETLEMAGAALGLATGPGSCGLVWGRAIKPKKTKPKNGRQLTACLPPADMGARESGRRGPTPRRESATDSRAPMRSVDGGVPCNGRICDWQADGPVAGPASCVAKPPPLGGVRAHWSARGRGGDRD